MTVFSGLGATRMFDAAVLLVAAGAMSLAALPAHAQTKAAGKKAPQSAWVKLCEAATLGKADKTGKVKKEKKNICLTHHERLDGNTGMVIVSAAIRQVQGQKNPSLMVMVPLGMAIPAGVKAAVYTKEQWARAQKKERVNDKELKPLTLKYTLCHAAGCTAEVQATKGLIDTMNAGGGLMILALNAAGRPVAFPVPLTGFPQAHGGKPVDNKKYSVARRELMKQIRARMVRRMAEQRLKGDGTNQQPVKQQ